MGKIKNLIKRSSLLTAAVALFGIWVVSDVFLLGHASAAQITSRKLTVSSSANGSITTGAALSGTNGAKTKHTFDFTLGTTGTVGSVEFQYCTTPLPGTTCTAPTGMDASTVTSIGGTSATGWSLGTAGNAPTATRIRITHTAASMSGAVQFTFGTGSGGATDYIKNPTTDNTAFFVRITTFSDTAWTTTVDQGTVANSTADQIDITAKVQETLNFSVGSTYTTPTSSCVALTNANLPLGSPSDGVLDFTQAYDAHSYFRLSTNANSGTVVYYSGDTLKNGANSITAIGTTATASAPGTSQFGLGIDSGDSNHSFTNLTSTAPYDQANGLLTAGTTKFAFTAASVTTPAQVASASGTVTCDTGSVRYLGNISTTTPPGIYTTTLSYIATPTY